MTRFACFSALISFILFLLFIVCPLQAQQKREVLVELKCAEIIDWPEYVIQARPISDSNIYRVWLEPESKQDFEQLLQINPDVVSWEYAEELHIQEHVASVQSFYPIKSQHVRPAEYPWFQHAEISELQVLGLGTDIVVAVADTGLDLSQPDLVQNLWPGMRDNLSEHLADYSGFNLGDQDSKGIQDHNGHGTLVSRAIINVAPEAFLLPMKINQGSLNYFSTGAAVEAIYMATELGADVINLSFTGPSESKFLSQAVRHAYKSGSVLVAAAGNFDYVRAGLPAGYPGVISVGALDKHGQPSSFSPLLGVDLLAPGEEILLKGSSGEQVMVSGTSFSAALVSGAACVLLSRNPHLQPDNTKALLQAYQPGPDLPRLNGRAILHAASPKLGFYAAGKRNVLSKEHFQVRLYLPPLDTAAKLCIAAQHQGHVWLLDNKGVWQPWEQSRQLNCIELPVIDQPLQAVLFGTDGVFADFSVHKLAPGVYTWLTGIADEQGRMITPPVLARLNIHGAEAGVRTFDREYGFLID